MGRRKVIKISIWKFWRATTTSWILVWRSTNWAIISDESSLGILRYTYFVIRFNHLYLGTGCVCFLGEGRVINDEHSNIGTATSNKAIRGGKYFTRHMPVLGNVHPIKIENVDIFSWRHFSARSSCYIINWYGYPRGSHEKYLKEIVSPVFEIRYWIVTC